MYAEKLYIKDKRGTSGNARLIELAISLRRRDIYFPTVAYMHLLQSYYPARNQFTQPECRRYSTPAAIECLAVDGLSYIVDYNDTAAVGRR